MPPFKRNDSGKSAAIMLATSFVIACGGVATAFVLLSAADQLTWRAWAVWAGLLGGVILMVARLWLAPERSESWLAQLWASRREDAEAAAYQPRYRRSSTPTTGTQKPPTVESIRAIAEESSAVLWVPRGSAPDRPHPPRNS